MFGLFTVSNQYVNVVVSYTILVRTQSGFVSNVNQKNLEEIDMNICIRCYIGNCPSGCKANRKHGAMQACSEFAGGAFVDIPEL